jgi:hypothetical protein
MRFLRNVLVVHLLDLKVMNMLEMNLMLTKETVHLDTAR